MLRISLNEHDGAGAGRRDDRGQDQEYPPIEGGPVDNVPGDGLDEEGGQAHEGEGRADAALVPTESDEVDSLEDVEAVAQFAEGEGYQGKGQLGREVADVVGVEHGGNGVRLGRRSELL